MHLYSRSPLTLAPDPRLGLGALPAFRPQLRWHPLQGEWVCYGSPLALGPLLNLQFPGSCAVVEGWLPTLAAADSEELYVPSSSDVGHWETLFFCGAQPQRSVEASLDALALMLEAWSDRTRTLSAMQGIKYLSVLEEQSFGNGALQATRQMFALPFVPVAFESYLERQKAFHERSGASLLAHIVHQELLDGRRLIYGGPEVAAFVPVFARQPYEIWIAPHRPVAGMEDLKEAEFRDLASALKTVLLKAETVLGPTFTYHLKAGQKTPDPESAFPSHWYLQWIPTLPAGEAPCPMLPEEAASALNETAVSLE